MLVSEGYQSVFSALKEDNVLEEIRPESLSKHILKTFAPRTPSSINLLVLSCWDGHQFMDTAQRTKLCCEEMRRSLGMGECDADCFHWKTVHGGPYVLSVPCLKTQTYRDQQVNTKMHVLQELEEAMSLKKLNVFLFIPHCVCGKMKNIFHRPEEYVRNAAKAKQCAMRWFNMESEQIMTWLQVCQKDGRQMHHVDYRNALRLAA